MDIRHHYQAGTPIGKACSVYRTTHTKGTKEKHPQGKRGSVQLLDSQEERRQPLMKLRQMTICACHSSRFGKSRRKLRRSSLFWIGRSIGGWMTPPQFAAYTSGNSRARFLSMPASCHS